MVDNTEVINILQDTIHAHKTDIYEAAEQIRALTKKIERRNSSIQKEQKKIFKLILESK